jgi:hypothetical protein
MKGILFAVIFIISALQSYSQPANVREINDIVAPGIALEPLMFLASDELMGRSPRRPEINVAARYISEKFKSFNIKQPEGTRDYFQEFEIKMTKPAGGGSFKMNSINYNIGDKILQISGGDVSLNAPIVFAGYGSEKDLEKIDVKGKIVVTNFGSNDSSSVYDGFATMDEKNKLLSDKGAVAIIHRVWQTNVPWARLHNYFTRERFLNEEEATYTVFIVEGDDPDFLPSLKDGSTATLQSSGNTVNKFSAKNVVGWIEGTDAKLKNQFIVLSAHYDHIGVADKPKMEDGKMDSIFNGARDNAVGVTAVINAARYFSKHPPKRSVLLIAYTAEEMGLIGSRYFADNPILPLKKLVYNLNIDNASYNDTTLITVVGLGRTSADNDIKNAAAAYGLKAVPDPAPEQNLFDRSDNVSLAEKGIPAPTFSLGIARFDSVIMKRYHQLSDETGNFSLTYALKYIRSFVLAAQNIANNPNQPAWIKNDKYESAWKKLYTSAE